MLYRKTYETSWTTKSLLGSDADYLVDENYRFEIIIVLYFF